VEININYDVNNLLQTQSKNGTLSMQYCIFTRNIPIALILTLTTIAQIYKKN